MSWRSKLQSTIALSTMKAEYMALINVGKEATWVRTILCELKLDEHNSINTH